MKPSCRAALVLLLLAAPVAQAQHNPSGAGSMPMHHPMGGMAHSHTDAIPIESGQAAFRAIAEIVAGRVDMMFGNLAEILPHIRSGGVRAIAFTSVPPSPLLPGVPTVAESLPGYVADNWFGLGAPAGLPQPIADRLNAEVNKMLKDKDFADKLVSLGFQPIGGSVEDMKQTIQRDRARWKKVIEAAGITAE